MFHFSKEVSRTHGVPFKFVVKPVSEAIACRVLSFSYISFSRARNSRTRRNDFKLVSVCPTRISQNIVSLLYKWLHSSNRHILKKVCARLYHFVFSRSQCDRRGHNIRPQIRCRRLPRPRSPRQIRKDTYRRREGHRY